MQVVILANAPGALIELCGITLLERLLRTLQRVGVRAAVVISETPETIEAELRKDSPPRSEIAVKIVGRALRLPKIGATEEVSLQSDLRLTLPGDAVWDPRLLQLLLAQTEPCQLLNIGEPTGATVSRSDAQPIRALEIAEQPTYSLTMRRHLPLLFIPMPNEDAERRILDAAQKGSQDLPALVHAPIETLLVGHLCKTRITPNELTGFCNLVAWMTAILFAFGYLVAGTLCALAIGVLDGLDGKQARVKVETSEAGKLEHWFDTFFELAWAIALAFHFYHSGALPRAWWYLLLLLAAEGVDGLAKLSVIRRYGRLIDELTPLDRRIRLLGGRRNIYVWILAIGLIAGGPAKAFVIIAWWETVSALIHVARAIWVTGIRPLHLSS
jgi:phosphatidylglycerophosphate synthase